MTWVKTDDGAPEHMKHRGAGTAAYAFWNAALAYSNRHLLDGRIEEHLLSDVWRPIGERFNHRAAAEKLVLAVLWHREGEVCDSKLCPAHPVVAARLEPRGGFLIHDYFEYQRSKAEILADRAKGRDRVRKHRQRSLEEASAGVSNGVTGDVTDPVSNAPPDPVPDPEPGGERDQGAHALTLEEVEALGRARFGPLAAAGDEALAVLDDLGDVRREELVAALKSEGRTWLYVLKVVATSRRPKPPKRTDPRAPQPSGQGRRSALDVLREKGMLP